MDKARGEFIAIFDADFIPDKSFLKNTLTHFENENVGVVQTRWEHLNQDYSLLTRVQAFQLNVHFTVEQSGRDKGDLLLQFNGTAGVWRREAIDDAGGWEADTLTEDLDLSYRSQLKGWEIIYLEDIVSPAELPSEINGLRSQQYRWMKGGAETARKVLPQVWSSDLPFYKKIHASAHLLGSSVFLAVFVISFFSVPVAFMIKPLDINPNVFVIFLASLLSIIVVYFVANVQVAWRAEHPWKRIVKFVIIFPLFLSLSMGLSFHNSLAVIQGYLGKKTPFVRTPKFNIRSVTDRLNAQSYLSSRISGVSLLEGILFIYFLLALTWGIANNEKSFVFLHLLLTVGYGLLFYFSVRSVKFK
jgi:cellulose synthase/poly-beta-1,6-N-acetylglucosamine synthase-like glycosyltransferase